MLYWSGKLIFKNQFAEFSFQRIPKVSFFSSSFDVMISSYLRQTVQYMSKEQKEMYLFIVKTSNCPCNCCEKKKDVGTIVRSRLQCTIIVRCKNASNRHQTLRVSLASSLYQHSMNYDSCTDNICFFHIKIFLPQICTDKNMPFTSEFNIETQQNLEEQEDYYLVIIAFKLGIYYPNKTAK